MLKSSKSNKAIDYKDTYHSLATKNNYTPAVKRPISAMHDYNSLNSNTEKVQKSTGLQFQMPQTLNPEVTNSPQPYKNLMQKSFKK
mgnify:CR=1 FL=1